MAPEKHMMQKGREKNPFPASQAAAHTRQPHFGVGAARDNFYSPSRSVLMCPHVGAIGGEGGAGGGDGGRSSTTCRWRAGPLGNKYA